jgi:enterochelin esterase-like enzyme
MRAIAAVLAGLLALPGRAVAQATPCCAVTIRARVPEGTGPVYLTGNLAELGPWRPDGKRMDGEGRGRQVRVVVPRDSAFKFKFTLGSWNRQALNADGSIPDDSRLVASRDTAVAFEIPRFNQDSVDFLADWRGSGVLGTLVYWRDVHSAFLGPDRNVEVWLPPEYDTATATRYPVLYMADGQNLFDPRLSFTGVDWGVDESVMRLVRRGVIPPIIVVGVWNSPRRSFEYSPWHGAPQYARFLIEELMPRVNREFRTRTGPANTAVMGSSMGGILSFYLVTYHPEVFGACGCISTPFLLSEAWSQQLFGGPAAMHPDTVPYIVHDIANGLKPPPHARYWFDYGTMGIDSTFGPTEEIARRWLLRQGLVEGRDFVMRRYEGATHNEAAWRARLDDPLTFLFGAGR